MTTQYNWKPVIESFVSIMLEDKWKCLNACDGETKFTFLDKATKENVLKKATETATSTDSSSITFKKGDYGITAYLILGNDPDELVSDIGSNSTMAEQAFNKPWQTFMNKWECKKCPTITIT
jgi:hypothetical protein